MFHAISMKIGAYCIANMGKGEHISMPTLIKVCETLNCDISDVVALVPDDDP